MILGAIGLAWAFWQRPHPEARTVIAFLVASLVVYAIVCGGLSAPVPRYQGRLIWIVPLLAAVLAGRLAWPPAGTVRTPAGLRAS